ncbi:MAG TPA: DUF1059 domain-containing protein [Anaerolineaceae bacterium]|nr:DUF1059 domain-containing protein [Anaerolineaceae bacterium]
MVIIYTCKGMGLSCPFSVKGGTVEEVTQQALDHVREFHAGEFNLIQTPEQIQKMEEALAHSLREVSG